MAAKYLLKIIMDPDFQKLSAPARLVYFVLRAHKNKNSNKCWPSIRVLVRETGLSTQSVCKAIKDLESAGLITIERTQNTKNPKARLSVYTVIDNPEISCSTNRNHKQAEHLAKARSAKAKKAKKMGKLFYEIEQPVLQNREAVSIHRGELLTMNSLNVNSTPLKSPNGGIAVSDETASLSDPFLILKNIELQNRRASRTRELFEIPGLSRIPAAELFKNCDEEVVRAAWSKFARCTA